MHPSSSISPSLTDPNASAYQRRRHERFLLQPVTELPDQADVRPKDEERERDLGDVEGDIRWELFILHVVELLSLPLTGAARVSVRGKVGGEGTLIGVRYPEGPGRADESDRR